MSLKKDHAGKGGAGKNRAGCMKLTDRLHRPAPPHRKRLHRHLRCLRRLPHF